MELNEMMGKCMMISLSRWEDADLVALNMAATYGTMRIPVDTTWGKLAVKQSLADQSGRITEELVAALSAEINKRIADGTWGAS